MFAQARQIGFRVRGGLDLVLRVQEARLIEVGAHILRDGVGPVAPAAGQGSVAIGELVTFQRGRIGGAGNLDVRAGRVGEAGGAQRVEPAQSRAEPLRRLCTTRRRAVVEPCFQRHALAVSMPSELACAWVELQMLFGELLEEGGRGGLSARLSGPQRRGDQAQRCDGSGPATSSRRFRDK
jgi:hypothetical protein